GRPASAAARAARAARAPRSPRRRRPSRAAAQGRTRALSARSAGRATTARAATASRVLDLVERPDVASLQDERAQARAQLIRDHAALDLSVDDERDAAGLLRHDDRDRVVLLGEADRRAVPRAELLAQARVHRERQKAGGSRDAI